MTMTNRPMITITTKSGKVHKVTGCTKYDVEGNVANINQALKRDEFIYGTTLLGAVIMINKSEIESIVVDMESFATKGE